MTIKFVIKVLKSVTQKWYKTVDHIIIKTLPKYVFEKMYP